MVYIYDTPIGRLGFSGDDAALRGLYFTPDDSPTDNSGAPETVRQAALEVLEYLAGQRKRFGVPVAPQGTDFQRRVWNALCDIPYGETRSYGQIAEAVNNPKGSRAVGRANHDNPISIIIPCHRVIRSDASLGGYGGGLSLKHTLLRLEGADL